MQIFSIKFAFFAMLLATCFAFTNFKERDVTLKFGQVNEISLVEGAGVNQDVAVARLARAAAVYLAKASANVLEGTCNAVLHDASTLLNRRDDPSDVITAQIRQKSLEARMASL